MQVHIIGWVAFNVLILAMLMLDLGVFHRQAHEIKIKEALVWSAIWIVVALIFNVWVYYISGKEPALYFLTGYILERSLSVDNIFVFLLVFSYFGTPSRYQYKILFWGILGALIMRAFFIGAGIALIHLFYWVIYVFGAFLVFTGIKLLYEKDKEVHPEKNPILKLFKRIMPISDQDEKGSFFIKKDGRRYATPLLVVLLIIESTDIIFAMDSIPAILAITTDPFIVFSSNVFAILGLRAMYFAIAGMMKLFHHLHYGLSVILVFVGVKMLISEAFKIPIIWALSIIMGVLVISVITSVIWPKKQ